MAESKRIESVDILRGLTMAFMIVVNNPGSWEHVYAPLLHARWNGLTPTDCIFPVFLFLMGFSIYLSMRKGGFQLTRPLVGKILKRFVLLLVIGFLLPLPFSLAEGEPVRYPGVLQRFALCYLAAALLVCTVNKKWLPAIAGALLVLYSVLLVVGSAYPGDTSSWLSKVDVGLFGDHIYEDHFLDPEGVLSTIPAIAHTLIGFLAARVFMEAPSRSLGIRNILIFGGLMLLAGWLLHYGLPINKKLWSPSFVLVTCGIGCQMLGLLTWAVDEKQYIRHNGFWKVFGTNSILCYMLSYGVVYALTFLRPGGESLSHWLNTGLQAVAGTGCLASLLYALVLVGIIYLIVLPLYRRRIFVKL